MLKQLHKWWRALWPEPVKWRRIEIRVANYADADRMIRESAGLPESQQWVIAVPEEDFNHVPNLVYLERRERVQ